MHQSFRNHVVSGFMLLPAATLLAVLPAVAQAQQSRPQIGSFQASADGRLEPGTLLTFRLEGTPRAQASVRIRGLDAAIPLPETGYGVYVGSYTLKRTDRIAADSPVRATVDDGRRAAAADYQLGAILPQARAPIGAPRTFPAPRQAVDNQPPNLTSLVPRDGETVAAGPSVHIAATFDDAGGSGVDPASVRIAVSGRDVTPQAQINRQSVSFSGALPPGRHTVEVIARDVAGNAVRKTWSFEVARAAAAALVPAPVAVAPVPASLAVQVVNHSPNGEIGPDPALVVGRTAPNALVAVRVEAFPPPTVNAPPRLVLSQTLQANREGIVSFTMVPGIPTPGERYEIVMVASQGNLKGQESRFTLVQRPN
ncbi:MAG: hypothetical protein JWQ33_1169 [Ramlibacter sp.]|nr:hypothetical protein [Ramlibacter sp.]